MGLKLYNKKRDFQKTKEPKGKEKSTHQHRFVVQEHHATRLHFDFRLEMDGVMKSWAVPKGPSLNPDDKRLAMMVEDHPIDYMYFQGAIPLGQYGGGEVRTWDIGTYEPVGDTPIQQQLAKGKLTFIMHGKRLKGEFVLVHMHAREENAWLLRKADDEYADPEYSLKQILHYGSRSDKPGAKPMPTGIQKALAKLKPLEPLKPRSTAKPKTSGVKAKASATKAPAKSVTAKSVTAKRVAPKAKAVTGSKTSALKAKPAASRAAAKATASEKVATKKAANKKTAIKKATPKKLTPKAKVASKSRTTKVAASKKRTSSAVKGRKTAVRTTKSRSRA